MSRNDRWNRIAEAFADDRYDDALEDLVEPIFGDVPPKILVYRQFDHPRLYRLWHTRMERTWAIWLKDQNLPEIDQFHLNRELSNVFKFKFRTLKKGERRKYRSRA